MEKNNKTTEMHLESVNFYQRRLAEETREITILESLYTFKLIGKEGRSLRLLNEAYFGLEPFFEGYRNNAGGLIIALDLDISRFRFLNTPDLTLDQAHYSQFFAHTKLPNGDLSGNISAIERNYIFLKDHSRADMYNFYLPIEHDANLVATYIAGEMKQKLKYMQCNAKHIQEYITY